MDFYGSDACEREPDAWEALAHDMLRDTYFTRQKGPRAYDEATFFDRGHHVVCRLPDPRTLSQYVRVINKQYDEERSEWIYTVSGRLPGLLSDFDYQHHPRWRTEEGRKEFERMRFSAPVFFTVTTNRDVLPNRSYTTIPDQQHAYRNVQMEYDTELPYRPAAPETEGRRIFARVAAMMAGVSVLVGSCMYAQRDDGRPGRQELKPAVQPHTFPARAPGYDPSILRPEFGPLSDPGIPGYTSLSPLPGEYPGLRSKTDLPQ